MKTGRVTFKLVIAFGALIGILLGIGWLGLSRMAVMNGNIQEITDRRWAKVLLAHEALRCSSRNSRITMQIFLLDDRKAIASLLEERAKNTARISELLKRIEAELESETEQALVAAIWTNRNPYVESYQRALSLLLKEGQPAAGRELMAKVVTPNLLAYHQAWERFVLFQGERMAQAGQDSKAYYVATRRLVVLLLTLALILAAAIAFFVTRGTSREIGNRLRAEQGLREAHETLEQRVNERTRELRAANAGLDAATQRAHELAERAESASRAKGEFLASMSHEIRTPMNGVMGMLGLLHDSELSDRQREYVQIASSSAESLLNIINDILDFSKIEAGKMTLEPIAFDLQTAVEEVGEILAAKVADKGLDLIVRFAPDAPRHVIGDPGRVRQVLTNLVGNAVKFTAKGHVLISVQGGRQMAGQAQLRFSVQDTGIGIAPDKLAHIFEKFAQADASTTRRFGGTGLGLAISKQLVELMGGEIAVTSQPGQGSTFSFTLPFNLPREPLPAAPPRTFLEGVRVLIVDDNEVNRRVLHEQVSSWRMRNGGFASGEEALAKLREARAAGDPYHIAILDHQMPGMDGEMLARAIKADPELRATLLVMLTSLGHPESTRRWKEAGIFACLLKPVRQSKLWDVLAEAWGEQTRQSPVALLTRPASAPPPPAGKTGLKVHARVLVVDDNTTNQQVARLMLENLRCRVDVAANGKEAIEMLALLPYDVVFMDCEMPEMDGYEATADIRRRQAGHRHVPVVAMTAKAIQGDRERCLEAGMDDYISKPVRLEDLEAALARHVCGNGNGVESRPKSNPPPAPLEALAPALDPVVTARLRGLAAAADPSILREIYEAFLSSAADYLAAIREGAARNHAGELRKAAHAFKGASANIGAQNLAEVCRQLEAPGEAGPMEGAGQRLAQLEEAFAQVRKEIEKQTAKEATA